MGDSNFLNDVCYPDQLSWVWLCLSLIGVVNLFFSFPFVQSINPCCCMCGQGFIVSDIVRLIADIFLVIILGFNSGLVSLWYPHGPFHLVHHHYCDVYHSSGRLFGITKHGNV